MSKRTNRNKDRRKTRRVLNCTLGAVSRVGNSLMKVGYCGGVKAKSFSVKRWAVEGDL